MEKYNYTGVLCLHPYFSKQWIDFKQNKIFSVLSECNYQKLLLNEGAEMKIVHYSNSTAQNPKCVEVPIYFEMLLRELMVELGSPEHKWKMKIVEFLKQHGVDYYSAPIPEYNIERAKELYPDSWEEYLKKYFLLLQYYYYYHNYLLQELQ